MNHYSNKKNSDLTPVIKLTYKTDEGKYVEAKPTEKFIKGPIPFDWLAKANSLRGKAGQVGMALWFLSGVKQSKTVKISAEAERLASCARQTFSSGLASLETAGLISVERRPGQKPTVTILNCTDTPML